MDWDSILAIVFCCVWFFGLLGLSVWEILQTPFGEEEE